MVENPAMEPFAERGSVARRRFECGEAAVDEVIAHMLEPRIALRRTFFGVRVALGVGCRAFACQLRHLARHILLRHGGALRDPLHDVAIPVACGEVHPRIIPRRVLAQDRLHGALSLDEGAPVHPADRSQARDAVGHHELGEREALGRAGGSVVGRDPLLVYPLLEPDEGGKGPRAEPELVEEARDELRGQLVRGADEFSERGAERGSAGIVRGLDAGGPFVGPLDFVEALDSAERHPSNALDEAQAQHCRDRPELPDRKR